MANRLPSPKLLQNLRSSVRRPLNSAAPSISLSPVGVSQFNLDDKPDSPYFPTRKPSPPAASIRNVLNLENVEALFSSVPTMKLLRSALNLHMTGISGMVDVGKWVMDSDYLSAMLLKEVSRGIIKHTFYDHFCAGENAAEAGRTAERLWQSGIRGMPVYACEHANDNQSCDRNLEAFLRTIESTKSIPSSAVSFVIVKITALCPAKLLKRVSDQLRWEYNNPSFQLPWKRHTLPVFSNRSPFYHTPTKPDPLTPEEEEDLFLGHQRLLRICQKCLDTNVPLSIDAEDTYVQPAIDYFTYSTALMYNRGDNPIIYGTIQTYLKDAKERLVQTANIAEKMGIPMGFKVVRGAYMSSERQLASSLGVESPIHDTLQDTHACFNECASFMLEKIADGSGGAILATHNVQSGNMAAARAEDLGIDKKNEKLQFAQLYGMADALSFSLRNAGFQVSKYMPYGPVEVVIPYLIRRAEENRGFLSTSTLDRELLRKELKRRLKAVFD
ncbi:proline dehydrogenase [Bertholletia excelsa]